MEIALAGIDCATDDTRIGLALGAWGPGGARLTAVTRCTRERSAALRLAEWLQSASGPALLAIDAPLGWPAPLGRALASHRAGEPVATAPNELFRRATDRFVQKTIGKTPLDVGADRIARTAHAALRLLGELRRLLGVPVPLAWSPEGFAGVAAIEVYPAATLRVYGLRARGYKRAGQRAERRELIAGLGTRLSLPRDGPALDELEASADALDAAVCVLAGADFLAGRARPPTDAELAKQEGWIWVSRDGAALPAERGRP